MLKTNNLSRDYIISFNILIEILTYFIRLAFYQTKISDDVIKDLTLLKTLRIQGMNCNDISDNSIKNLTNLITFSFEHWSERGDIIESPIKLKTIKSLKKLTYFHSDYEDLSAYKLPRTLANTSLWNNHRYLNPKLPNSFQFRLI
jgi:hypothetical protein